jgi:DNA repair exonuclease SbcCD nuclease subunit
LPKIYVISDLHFSNRTAFAKESTQYEYIGCNSRFHFIVDAFNRCVDEAVKAGAEALVICGDVFHERGKLPISVMNAVSKVFENAAKKLPIYAFPGNHDYISMTGDIKRQALHSLYLYKDIINVVHSPEIRVTDSFAMAFVPFTPDKTITVESAKSLFDKIQKHERKRPSIVFFHHSFNGAVTGPTNWMMPYPLDVSDVPEFNTIISGHLHLHQTIGNLIYVGSPLQHDLGERNYSCGWLNVNYDGSWSHNENRDSPKFNLLETSNTEEVKNYKMQDNDYLVVRWSGLATDAYRLREEKENLLIESQSKPNLVNLRSTIKRDDPIPSMISKYVEHEIADPNERTPYIEFGMKYLK